MVDLALAIGFCFFEARFLDHLYYILHDCNENLCIVFVPFLLALELVDVCFLVSDSVQ